MKTLLIVRFVKLLFFSFCISRKSTGRTVRPNTPIIYNLKYEMKVNPMNYISEFSFAETRRSELVLISELQARFYGKLQFLKNCNILKWIKKKLKIFWRKRKWNRLPTNGYFFCKTIKMVTKRDPYNKRPRHWLV